VSDARGHLDLQPPDERVALVERLDQYRAIAQGAIADLEWEVASAKLLPATDMTMAGIVKHLAWAEDRWFQGRLLGMRMPPPWDAPGADDPDQAMRLASGDSVPKIVELHSEACDRSRAALSLCDSLDTVAKVQSFGRGPVNLRWILVHMIDETARHAGHLDLLSDCLRVEPSKELTVPLNQAQRWPGGRWLVLETSRLLLAALLPQDQAEIYRLYASPEVARNLARLPARFTMGHALEFVNAAQAGLIGGHAYTLGVFLRDSGVFVGICALRLPAREPGLDEQERAEAAGLGILGYSVLPEHWGRGYAGESCARLVRYALEDLALSVLQASPRCDNLPSARVLLRLGFTLAEDGVEEQPLAGGPAHLVDRYVLQHRRLS